MSKMSQLHADLCQKYGDDFADFDRDYDAPVKDEPEEDDNTCPTCGGGGGDDGHWCPSCNGLGVRRNRRPEGNPADW